MAAASPSYLTMSYDGSQGDREFIFSCKGRPFSVLTEPNFPTPPSTMVDYNLVRDLKLRITDLQCAKLVYAGQKFRILGRVSTSVQCISDGAPAGNTHFKALVVQDLYQNLDTHSIAGQKLSDKLIGPPYELLSEPEEIKTPTEPTNAKKIQKPSLEPSKSKKRKKVKISKTAPSVSTDDEIVSDSSDPPPSPRPKCQGKWTRNQYFHGWHPIHGDGRDNLKTCYENRKTGSVTYGTPVHWFSDGSLHSLATVDRDDTEYSD